MSPVANANANDTSPVSKVPLYEGSTQYRNWRYSTEQLSHIRNGLNEAAVAVIRETFETDQVRSSLLLIYLPHLVHA
jgi:cyclin H